MFPVDGPGGVDNAFGYFVQQVRNFLPDNLSSDIYTQLVMGGNAGLVVHVTGYDAQADDDDVQVEMLTTAPYRAYMDGGTARPRWDGNDVFPIDARSVSNGDLSAAKTVDPHAYVSGNKLVATFGSMDQPMVIGLSSALPTRFALHLQLATLVCTITTTQVGPWGYRLSCNLSGRWNADDLVHQLSVLPDPTDLQNPRPLCTNSAPYATFKNIICGGRDVSGSVSKSPEGLCDSLSFGMNFETIPARLGNVYAVAPSMDTCPMGFDPANDSCNM